MTPGIRRLTPVRRLIAVGSGILVAATLAGCSSSQEVYVGRPADPAGSTSPTPTLTPAVPGKSGVARAYTVKVGATTRTYRLHVPLAAPPGPRPLIIAFHDAGSTADQLREESGLDGAGDRGGVIVAYPEAVSGHWNNGLPANAALSRNADDLALVPALILDVAKRARLDSSRVIASGIGDGAVMALRVGSQAPKYVRGVAAIEGGLVNAPGAPRPRSPMSLLLIRATEDPNLPWTGTDDSRSNGPQMSADDTVGAFRAADRLTKKSVETERQVPDRDPADGSLAFRSRWIGGLNGTFVTLYKLAGAGGAWPGGTGQSARTRDIGALTRDISGANTVVQFAVESTKL